MIHLAFKDGDNRLNNKAWYFEEHKVDRNTFVVNASNRHCNELTGWVLWMRLGEERPIAPITQKTLQNSRHQ